MNNNRNVFFAVLLMCLATTIAISGCVDKDQENDDVIVMTFGQYLADSSMHVDNETKQMTEWLWSLNPGDILLVRDTINNITFLETLGGLINKSFYKHIPYL